MIDVTGLHEQLNNDRAFLQRLQADVGIEEPELIITSIILHEHEQEREREHVAELREQRDIDRAFIHQMHVDLNQVQAELIITSAIIHEQEHADYEQEHERRWIVRLHNIKKPRLMDGDTRACFGPVKGGRSHARPLFRSTANAHAISKYQHEPHKNFLFQVEMKI